MNNNTVKITVTDSRGDLVLATTSEHTQRTYKIIKIS